MPERVSTEAVVDAASEVLSQRGAEWFPQLDPARLVVTEASRRDRPRCLLVRLRVHDGAEEVSVVLKARRIPRNATAPRVRADRPTMLPAGLLTEAEMSEREFVGLQVIYDGFQDLDAYRFGRVRPLAIVPGHSAFLLDYVDETTMRSRLMARSRLRPGAGAGDGQVAFANAGAWLRHYHQLRPAVDLHVRNDTAAAVADLLPPYAEYLGRHLGQPGFFTALARTGARLAASAWPARFPLVLGHGDFVVRNLFESSAGKVTVIDPLARWLVPPHEDISRFLIGVRLLGMQVVSHGLAFGAARLAAYESAFLSGYFGPDPVPTEELRAYQLLVLLDKWSTAVRPAQPRGLRRLPAQLAHRWNDDYFRREARRLVAPIPDE